MGRFRLLIVAILSTAFFSCPVDHPTSLVVLQAAAMSRQMQCTIQANAQAQYIRSFGVLDLAITNHYYIYPIVKNNMPSSMTISGEQQQNLHVETNTVTFYGADVRLDIPMEIYKDSLSDQNLLYKVQTEGFFAPGAGGAEPDQEGLLSIEAIPPDVGNVLYKVFKGRIQKDPCLHPSAWIYIYFKVRGVTAAGHEVVSNEFMLPVRLCWGCLVRYTTSNPKNARVTNTMAPCLPGQDEPMDNVLCTKMTVMYPDICYDRCSGKTY